MKPCPACEDGACDFCVGTDPKSTIQCRCPNCDGSKYRRHEEFSSS